MKSLLCPTPTSSQLVRNDIQGSDLVRLPCLYHNWSLGLCRDPTYLLPKSQTPLMPHITFLPRQIYLHTPGSDQKAHPAHQPSPLSLTLFHPSHFQNPGPTCLCTLSSAAFFSDISDLELTKEVCILRFHGKNLAIWKIRLVSSLQTCQSCRNACQWELPRWTPGHRI